MGTFADHVKSTLEKKYDKVWTYDDIPDEILVNEDIDRSDIDMIDFICLKKNSLTFIICKYFGRNHDLDISDLVGYMSFKSYFRNKKINYFHNCLSISIICNMEFNIGDFIFCDFKHYNH